MSNNTATLKIWLIGNPTPFDFELPADNALELQREIVEKLEAESPAGSISFPGGTLIRYAGIAASQLGEGAAEPWVSFEDR